MLRYLPGTPWNVPTSRTCGPCLPASAAPAAAAGNAKEVTSPPTSAAAATPDMTIRGTPPAPGLTATPSVHRRIYGKPYAGCERHARCCRRVWRQRGERQPLCPLSGVYRLAACAESAWPPCWPGSARLLEALRVAVQALGAVLGDQQQFSGLDAGVPVAGYHVRLHDHCHPGCQHELGPGQRPARGRHDGREVAAAEAVHQIVDCGEARLPDDGRGGRKIPSPGAGDQGSCDG